MIADKDLLSIQQARILAENALEAQKKLASFSQEKLDRIVESVAGAALAHAEELAALSHEETYYGKRSDKCVKNTFVCTRVPEALRGMHCVGVLRRDAEKRIMDIGVPVGVIAAICPVTSPVSTAIYKTLIAIKSGNAIIFSPHPRAARCMTRALDIMIAAAKEAGLPEGCLSYMGTVSKSGTLELMNHKAVSLILVTGVSGLYQAARCGGKPAIYGGRGNGPAFIERTADIDQAVRDIIASKNFDNGIAPSAEQSVVLDACVADAIKAAFVRQGAYFMDDEEAQKIAELFFYPDGRRKTDMVGVDAATLARRAGIHAPDGVTLLLASRKYVSDTDPYSHGFLAPVLACYIEDDWRHACEKCIELLLFERKAHTLVIHSRDEDVIMQFALKKPVARMLVNTPAALGSMGIATNLFPAMTLGSGSAGIGITADNVSPMNLVYIRKVGYGVNSSPPCETSGSLPLGIDAQSLNPETREALYKILIEAIEVIDTSSDR
ncbi:aldehyde dehydrogenase family protein [Desulfovibrio sp. OttesenSCG-928-G15]|nr:aldehyde dehydrogenase family protein [Desulfovibrio sp. OttesenSCG-928-G15]